MNFYSKRHSHLVSFVLNSEQVVFSNHLRSVHLLSGARGIQDLRQAVWLVWQNDDE